MFDFNEEPAFEFNDDHMNLLAFVKETIDAQGTCSFNDVASKFGNAMIMELMTIHNFITYDGRKPLGLKWTDIAEQIFSPDPNMLKWFAPAGLKRMPNDMIIVSFPSCDPRLSDVEELLGKGFESKNIPHEEQVKSLKIGQAVKLHSNGEFFWACVNDMKKSPLNPDAIFYQAKVVDGHMKKYGIKKDDVISLCPAHIFDMID